MLHDLLCLEGRERERGDRPYGVQQIGLLSHAAQKAKASDVVSGL